MDFKGTEIVKNFKHKFRDKILKYIDAMYSMKSELNKIDSWEERHNQACIKANISSKEDVMIEILNLKNADVNNLIFAYHTTLHNNKYQLLCSKQQLFWQIQRRLVAEIDPMLDEDELDRVSKLRLSLSNRCDELVISIERLKSEIFIVKNVEEMADQKIRQLLTPESRLKMLNQQSA